MENRQQVLYWNELVELKIACEYIRRYRDSLARTMTRFAMIRAAVSVSALGTWAAVKSYPMLWGSIIAAAQVLDALQNVIPYAARLRGSRALVAAQDALFIDCKREWEDVYAARFNEAEIADRRQKMKHARLEAEQTNLSSGLPRREKYFKLAKADANTYFSAMISMQEV